MSTKKKDIPEKGAILQRDGQTYAVTPRIPCGLITDFNVLRRIADAAERYGAAAIKVTSSQRLAVIGLQEQDLDAFWQDLGLDPAMALGMCIRNIKACPGTTYCRMGMQDSLGLGLRLEQRYADQPTPNKVKLAVSGCPMDCAESHVRDIGLVGNKAGWIVEVGGTAGASPRLATPIAKGLTEQQAEELVDKILAAYKASGKKKRLGAAVESMGIDAFKELVGL